jgi:acetyl/propionyl-CoA carboxylase alpha subunit
MDCEFILNGKVHRISLERKDDKEFAVVDGKRLELSSQRISPQSISLLMDGRSYLARVARDGEKTFVAIGTSRFCLEDPKQESVLAGLKGGASGKAEATVKAPMPGLVIKVNVEEGKDVNPGDSLVVVEAMKMEHDMRATFKARVEKVHVKAGQQVDAFQALVELVPLEG